MPLWQRCLVHLEDHVPPSEFAMWLKPLQAVESEEMILLYAPNRFVMDWVRERYLGKIEETLHSYSDILKTVELKIDQQIQASKALPPLASMQTAAPPLQKSNIENCL